MARVPASMPAVDRLGISAFRKMVIPMGIRQNTATYTFMPQIHSNSASGQDRAALINFFGRDTAIHHINNWMGDEGVIKSIGWSIMPAKTHEAYGKPVPVNPYFKSYLAQLPSMADKCVNVHGLTKDIALVKSVVADKYVKNGEYLVKLIWWTEDIDDGIYNEGCAEVALKYREEKI